MDLASGGSNREPVLIIQKISADVTSLPPEPPTGILDP
jgi:hypothetical protein